MIVVSAGGGRVGSAVPQAVLAACREQPRLSRAAVRIFAGPYAPEAAYAAMASGALAGLVAITPAAGFVGPMPAIVIGLIAGGLCYGGVLIKSVFKYDDSLDVVGIHGLGGTFGALATGVFASKAVNELGADGLLYGNPRQLWIQFVSVVATWGFCFVMTEAVTTACPPRIGEQAPEFEAETTHGMPDALAPSSCIEYTSEPREVAKPAVQTRSVARPKTRHGTLGGVNEKNCAVGHSEHALDLAAEVSVARGVDDVDLDASVFD